MDHRLQGHLYAWMIDRYKGFGDYTNYRGLLNVMTKNPEKNSDKEVFHAKKAQCEKRAYEVVNILIDDVVNKSTFLQNVKYLSTSHYQDVIEERSISNMCGYAICPNLLRNISNKKFVISSKTNKVFDISKRKSFCSDYCYAASKFVESQIPEGPIWWRDNEKPIVFELLQEKSAGLIGDEIQFDLIKTDTDNVDTKPQKVEVKKVTRKDKKMCSKLEVIKEETFDEVKSDSEDSCDQAINGARNNCDSDDDDLDEDSFYSEEESVDVSPPRSDLVGHCNDKSIIRPHETSKRLDENKPFNLKDNEIREKVEHVDLSFKEWFTLESVYEIIDEDTIKSNFKDKIISKFKDISITNQENDKKFARFREICRKLNLMEIRDKSIDEEIICKEKNNHNLQPAPNYNQLKKDAEELKIKVRLFYEGKFEETVKDVENDPDSVQAVLPLVDGSSQTLMRRKIFLQSMEKALKSVCHMFDAPFHELQTFMVNLSKTFNLTAKNITFPPKVSKYVGLLLLKIFARKNAEFQKVLLDKTSLQQTLLDEVDKHLASVDVFIENLLNLN